MNKYLSLAILICLFASMGYCSVTGASGAQFLKVVASPRAAALGSAYTAFSDDVNSIVFNPAGLAFLSKKEVALVQNNWIENISNQYIAFGMPSKVGAFGLSVIMLSVKDIDQRDITGTNTGKFDASDMAVGLSYAKCLRNNFSFGLNVKSINQKIDGQTASGIAADAGVIFKSSSKLDLGVSVLNLGNSIKFINEADPLPTTLKAGVCYKPIEKLKIGIDASKPNDADTNFAIGAEYCVKAGEKLIFPVRAGYRTGYETEQLSGLAAGIGVMYNKVLAFDFAWAPMGILGDTMKFGLSFKF